MEKLEYLWKDPDSGTGNCPGLIRGESGYYVVGVKLTAEQEAEVRALSAKNDAAVADHEGALFVPFAVLDKLKLEE